MDIIQLLIVLPLFIFLCFFKTQIALKKLSFNLFFSDSIIGDTASAAIPFCNLDITQLASISLML